MLLFKCRFSAPKDEDSAPEVKASEEDRSVDNGNKSGAHVFRFKPATTPDDLATMTMKNFAETTDKKIAWAAKLFNDWGQNRLKTSVDDSGLWNISWCNIDHAQDLNKSHLAYSLCSFLNKVHRQDGGEYPGKTLYNLVLCIQFHLEKQGVFWKLVDDQDFVRMKFCLDNLMKKRESARISGTGSVSAISDDQEELMWAKGVLGEENPDRLRSTVLYLISLNCALRGR